jgi:hypothetical protein
MRLAWYARRQDRSSRVGALFAAFVLTLGAGAILAGVYGTSVAGLRASFVRGGAFAYERIVFVAPAPTRLVSGARKSPELSRSVEARVAPAPAPASDTGSRPASTFDTDRVARVIQRAPGSTVEAADRARVGAPVLAPSGITAPRTALTAERRDSVLAQFAAKDVVERAMRMKPTQAQKDSIGRERASLFARAREEGRPVPVPMGGGTSISFPLFARGPSREQRRRDSIVHQGNLRRLERLAVRARARVDSSRSVDSIASLKAAAPDSMND